MKNRKIVKYVIAVGAVLMILLAGAYVLYRYVAPSNEQRDLNSVFKRNQGEIAIIIDDEQREEYGLIQEGVAYLPSEIVSEYMDSRVYVDAAEGCLSYAVKEGVIVAKAEEKEYQMGKKTEEAEHPILKKTGEKYYVSLPFIKEHASCFYKEYKNPSRVVVMSDRNKVYTMATLREDTRVRTGPGKKYPYLVEVPESGRVFVETDKKPEKEYMMITTQDGVTGYIPVERVAKQEESTWQFDKMPESFPQLSMKKSVCLGWHQVLTTTNDLADSVTQADKMNVISPTWYALNDNEGNFTSLASSSYVAQAHAKGLKVWGLINDFDKKLKLGKILGATSKRTKLVNSLVGSAIQNDLDGINVDFEKVTKDVAPAYLQFLRELTLKCHVNDLVVSVDNYAPKDYNSYYDLQEQGRIVDYVILMAYDEHYHGSEESGSVSSLPFVREGVEAMLEKVPAERLITALPFYTRLWKEVKGKKPVPEAYGMSAAESIVRANDATPKWDEKTGQYYAQFKSGSATYKIWLEEETSLRKKMQVVKKSKCAGVAFWKLGFERAVTWTTIGEVLK